MPPPVSRAGDYLGEVARDGAWASSAGPRRRVASGVPVGGVSVGGVSVGRRPEGQFDDFVLVPAQVVLEGESRTHHVWRRRLRADDLRSSGFVVAHFHGGDAPCSLPNAEFHIGRQHQV